MANILIVEDDTTLAATTRKSLELQGHKVEVANTGTEGWEMLQSFGYDLIILDWDLPGIQGIDILRRLRDQGKSQPVLMLTGKNHIDEKEQAFEAGSDDYITKPFHPRDLLARLKALLRRPPIVQTEKLSVRNIVLDAQTRRITRDSTEITVQPLEFDLLEFLLRHPNQVFNMDALIQRVWGADADVSLEAVYSCIKRLRRKLDIQGQPSIVRTVFGNGYCLDK